LNDYRCAHFAGQKALFDCLVSSARKLIGKNKNRTAAIEKAESSKAPTVAVGAGAGTPRFLSKS
jgi:hypothetical protein